MKPGLIAGLCLALSTGGAFAQGTDGNLPFSPTFDDIVNSQSGSPATSGPAAPTTPYNPNVDTQLAQLEPLLQQILQMQGTVLSQMATAPTSGTDPTTLLNTVNQIRLVVYGTDATHPQAGTLEGLYTSPTLSNLVNQLETVDPAAASQDVYYMRVMGEGGEWATVVAQENQIRNYLSANASVPSPYASASPSPVPTTPASPPGPPAPQTVDQINAQLSQIVNQLNANPPPPPDVQAQLQAQENALIAQRNKLQGPTASPSPGTPGAPGTTPSSASAPGQTPGGGQSGQAGQAGAGGGQVPLVPNSYSISPMVLSDAEIRAILDPLISQQLSAKNATLASQGLTMNADGQIEGQGVHAAYRPSWERYTHWMDEVPSMRAAVMKAAQDRYDTQLKALGHQGTPPPTSAAGNPSSQSGPGGTVTP